MIKNAHGGRYLGDWDPPFRLDQLDLFGSGRDWWLARTSVSLDDVFRWYERGWISFDIRDNYSLDEGQIYEILFVRNLAVSGLGDLWIERLLGELDPPYRYDPSRVAYSFAYGWVEMPPPATDVEVDSFMRRKLAGWLQDKALLGEKHAVNEVADALARAYEMAEVKKKREEARAEP